MGVAGLSVYIINSFPKQVIYFQEGEIKFYVEGLLIDGNAFIHPSSQRTFNYGPNKRMIDPNKNLTIAEKTEKVYEAFFEKIQQLSEIVVPTEFLYNSVDSSAPAGKRNQQRERRFISARGRDINNEDVFDSNALTVGTQFMHNLMRFLNFKFRETINDPTSRWHDLRIYFSPTSIPGEGEAKCMTFLRNLPPSEKNKKYCLVSPDGDVILLALASHLDNIYLLREDNYNTGHYQYFDMGEIRIQLPVVMNQLPGIKSGKRNLDDVSNDFVLAMVLGGDDFAPMIQMFHLLREGVALMIDVYTRTSNGGTTNQLTINNHPNLAGLAIFIAELSKYEVPYLLDQVLSKDPKKQVPRDPTTGQPIDKFKHTTLLKFIDSNNQLDFNGYRIAYYMKSHISTPEEIRKMCIDYIKTIVWIFEYYVNGLPDWQWAYRYHYSPLMTDLKNVLLTLTTKERDYILKFDIHAPSLPFEQLLSVLPPASYRLLPPEYSSLMLSEKSPLSRYYPKEFDIDYEGKLQEFKGIPLLPFVSYEDVHTQYEKIKDKHYHRNILTDKEYYFVYDPRYTADFVMDGVGTLKGMHVQKITY